MYDFPCPWNINKLAICNSIKRSLVNTEAYLRDLYNETCKGGLPGMNGEMRKEKSTGGPHMQPCSRELAAGLGEGRKRSSRKCLWWGVGTMRWGGPAGRAATSQRVTVSEQADARQSTGFSPLSGRWCLRQRNGPQSPAAA